MSSNCPPQLQLSIQPPASFKRSFEQFGFDLESPVGATDAGGSATNNGNDRSKRARSSSSFSESSDSTDASRSSSTASGSDSSSSLMSLSRHEPTRGGSDPVSGAMGDPELATRTSLAPPRLPTPMIQVIDMVDYAPVVADNTELMSHFATTQAQPQTSEDRYRLSLQRFNAFESEISVLRRSQPSSPGQDRLPTPPPSLPPLSISANRERLSASEMAFFHPAPRPTTPLFLEESFFRLESPSSTRAQSPTTIGGNSVHEEQEQDNRDNAPTPSFQNAHFRFRGSFTRPHPLSNPRMDLRSPAPSIRQTTFGRRTDEIDGTDRFRARLNTALERLRPASPLVPGLNDGEDADDDEAVEEAQVDAEISSRDDEGHGEDEEEDNVEEEEEDEEVDEDDDDSDDDENENVQSPTIAMQSQSLHPNPPTLPPIPPITAGAEDDDWNNPVSFLGQGSMAPPTMDPEPSHPSPAIGRWHAFAARPPPNTLTSLRDHPLPSPILRELHGWMDESRPPSITFSASQNDRVSSTSSPSAVNTAQQHQQLHPPQPTSNAESSSSHSPNLGFFESLFPPLFSSNHSTTSASPSTSTSTGSSSSMSHIIAAPGSSSGPGRQAPNYHSSSSSAASSTSELFASPAPSVSYSRNVADEAAVRSLDHGIGLGLGFGSSGGGYRSMPSGPRGVRPSGTYPVVTGGQVHEQTTRVADSGLGAGGGSSSDSQRNFQTFGTSSLWQYSAQQQDEGELDLDFSSLAGTVGSPSASSEEAASVHPGPLPAISGPYSTSSSLDNVFGMSGSTSSALQGSTFWEWNEPHSEPRPSASTPAPQRSDVGANMNSTQPPSYLQPGLHSFSSSSSSSRPGSYTSLVGENAAEVRRRADYAELERSRRIPLGRSDVGSASRAVDNGSSSSRPQTSMETLTNGRARALPGGAEALAPSRRPRQLTTGTSTTSTATPITGRDSALDSAILGRRGRWGLPMPDTSTTASNQNTNNIFDATGDVDMFGSTEFGGGPLSLHLPTISGPTTPLGEGWPMTGGASNGTARPGPPFPWLEISASSPMQGSSARVEDRNTTNTNTFSLPLPPSSQFSSGLPTPHPSSNERRRSYPQLGLADMMEGIIDSNTTLPSGFISRNSADDFASNRSSLFNSASSSNATYGSDAPSLPAPDLGGTFDATTSATANASSQQEELRRSSGINHTQRPTSLADSHSYRQILETAAARRNSVPASGGQPEPHIYGFPSGGSETVLERVQRERRRSQRVPEEMATQRRVERARSEVDRLQNLMQAMQQNVNAAPQVQPQPSQPPLQPRSSIWPSGGRRWPAEINAREELIRIQDQGDRQMAEASRPNLAYLRRPQHLSAINPESFTPGPFRNTLQHHLNEIRQRHSYYVPPPSSEPPSIPPLSLGENIGSLRSTLQHDPSSAQGSHQESSSSGSASSPTREALRRDAAQPLHSRPVRTADRPPAPPPRSFHHSSFASARAAQMNNENRRTNTDGRADVHNFISRHVRLEGSRVEDPNAYPVSRARRDPTAIIQARGAIDPLRPDGANANAARQRQVISNYHSLRDSDVPPPVIPTPPRNFEARRRYANMDGDRSMLSEGTAENAENLRRGEGVAAETDDEMVREGLSGQMMRGRRGRFTRGNPEVMFAGSRRRPTRALGDFMRDDDFDGSYESLLSLAQTLGDVKPRSTPADIIEKMETAQYKDWATPDSDQRCPICLDDYGPTDPVLKLNNCSHWLHQDCLIQWLTTANTCPVCRKSVKAPPNHSFRRGPYHYYHHHHHHPHLQRISTGNPSSTFRPITQGPSSSGTVSPTGPNHGGTGGPGGSFNNPSGAAQGSPSSARGTPGNLNHINPDSSSNNNDFNDNGGFGAPWRRR